MPSKLSATNRVYKSITKINKEKVDNSEENIKNYEQDRSQIENTE